MKIAQIASAITAAALIAVPLAGCSDDSSDTAATTSAETTSAMSTSAATTTANPARTPSQILSAHPWETTGAVDQDGNELSLTDANVQNYVGFAYFDADGTFDMYTLDDKPKMHGDWTVSADGKTRHIVARNDDGTVMFERDSEITELTDSMFTYRTYPDQNDKSKYVDIIHTPTDHPEPQR
ncbi:DUF4822 domain-containing protein [Nocardia ignorata]|uniref:Uncharacterized protein DUF4822 n=1 Tax=Nocardia ignorata TaxID=145285 RepID=A0A4R6PML6_NOCIG|nr:DUF4822 domain-containing protein [Nocardia ignorata]TDP38039.1 uncharacterized protein DUF4822 [Nocardia ignorata]